MVFLSLCLGLLAPHTAKPSGLSAAPQAPAANQAQAPAIQLPPLGVPDLPPAVPPANQLTLVQAIQTGLRDNPQVAAAHYSVISARENYNSQKAPLNPTFSYAALNNTVAPLSWSDGFNQGANYSAYVTLETNGAVYYRTWQAREQFHQAQFDAATTGLSLKLSIVDAYANLQVANRALEVELKVYQGMVQLGDLTQKRFEAGAGPEADATRARIAAIQEQQNVISDVANVNAARAALNTQLGHPQNAPVDVAEPLVYKPIPAGDLAQLTRQAEQNRPELRSALANLHGLRAVPGLERSAYFPNVVLGKDFGSDGQIFVGMSIPLDLGGIKGAVAKANADVRTQLAQVELQRQAIDADVKSSFINFTAAQKQVDTYQTGILSMSEHLVDQVRHGYELGANTIVDIITADNTYRSVETSYYAAVGAYEQAAYALKHSIGDLADTSVSGPLTEIGTAIPLPVSAAGSDKRQ